MWWQPLFLPFFAPQHMVPSDHPSTPIIPPSLLPGSNSPNWRGQPRMMMGMGVMKTMITWLAVELKVLASRPIGIQALPSTRYLSHIFRLFTMMIQKQEFNPDIEQSSTWDPPDQISAYIHTLKSILIKLKGERSKGHLGGLPNCPAIEEPRLHEEVKK